MHLVVFVSSALFHSRDFHFSLLNKNFVNLHRATESGTDCEIANNLHNISSKITIFTHADTFLSAAMHQAYARFSSCMNIIRFKNLDGIFFKHIPHWHHLSRQNFWI